MVISNGVQIKKAASWRISAKATPPISAKMKKVDEFMYANGPKTGKPKAVMPGSVTARKPAHVVTVKSAKADIAHAAKTSRDPKVKKAATALLKLMASFAKRPPRSASAKDKKAVRALWWIFSNPALSENKKKKRIIKLIASEEFDNPVIRSAILIALASKWGIQLFTGKCIHVPGRSYESSELNYVPSFRKCSYSVAGRCIEWEQVPGRTYQSWERHSIPSRISCSFKNTYKLRMISRIANGTRIAPIVHSAYLSLNKHVAIYIKASVEHLRRETKKKAIFDRAMARILKRGYAERTARYCKRHSRKCVTLKLQSGNVQVKKRSRVYRDLVKSGYIKTSR